MNPKCTRFTLPLVSMLMIATATSASEPPSFTREQLEKLAHVSSRNIQAARNQIEAATSAVTTSRAFPNPEIEYQKGQSTARQPTGVPGDVRLYTITQPIDLPWIRNARIGAAEASLESVSALGRGLEADIIARIRQRYFDVLRRQAELKAALEDQTQMEGVRDRIALRVETGEAPRFELIKADAEMLNSQKNAYTAELRVTQSRASLRALIGPALPEDFVLKGRLQDPLEISDIDTLRKEISVTNPDLLRARAEQQRATKQLDLERAKRLPTLSIRGSRDIDPELQISRMGVVMTIPLWDWRSGPIGEARANLSRTTNELAHYEFSLDRSVEVAYEQYQIAQAQVNALESGIVRQAESAVRIAEHAYRFGERGILEVLDAQRVFRAARNELINARYEAASIWAEIERLRAKLPTEK
ncbi:MAG: TolC family protein [Rhodocyclaceae bacterium]|nr:TolC family protein [Rhodocyclaceae bacterium]